MPVRRHGGLRRHSLRRLSVSFFARARPPRRRGDGGGVEAAEAAAGQPPAARAAGRLGGGGHRPALLERTAVRAAELVGDHAQAQSATWPLPIGVGPLLVGVSSPSKIAVGTYSVQQPAGVPPTALIRPSIGAVPRITYACSRV